jgi:AmmeMemoRadiSam system protein B
MIAQTIRPPAVAGQFYPATPNQLRKDIDGYLAQATPPALTNVRAVIAPHAGYMYSGSVAAYAYQLLSEQAIPPQRIYLLGPAHRVPFHGVALTEFEAFKTPLGDHPVDTAQVKHLIATASVFNALSAPHAMEHCLEVHIPFLQAIFPAVPIVPMLFGQVDPTTVGKWLHQVLEPDDLIIVSSDLSHFHNNEKAHQLDKHFLDAVLAGDERGVQLGEACGNAPALALMTVAKQRGWQPHILDYRTSGDVTGNVWEVVGYASLAYVEGT